MDDHEQEHNMRRILRVNRLLSELGHTDVITALEELQSRRAALPPTEQPEAAQDELNKAADRVVIANATGNPDLYREAVAGLLKAVRQAAKRDAAQAPQGGADLLGKPNSARERALIQAACSRHFPRPNKLTTSAKNRHIDQCQAFEIGWAECRAALEHKQGDAPQERAAVTDELRNMMGAHMLGDFVVQVEFRSCRAASAFHRALSTQSSEQKG